ncbi:Glycerol kinase [Thelohanellus kitauei]|uniref:Glycerol kinase n=1 Tax=Thelohanellus kitauei TaxID=669202 RepID=A0A0C2M7K2_THEKT|nr:Glycerol kinase [Thelohanellus kitauei]
MFQIGDQQASAFGCGCTVNNHTKATLGTGLFIDTFMDRDIIGEIDGDGYPVIAWYPHGATPSYLYESRCDDANLHLKKAIKDANLSNINDLEIMADKFIGFDSANNTKTTGIALLNGTIFKLDGGYSSSDYLAKGISSITNIKVVRMNDIESTSKGACFLARIGAGIPSSSYELQQLFDDGRVFNPDPKLRSELLALYESESSKQCPI